MGQAKQRGSFEERKKRALRNIPRGIITHSGNTEINGSAVNFKGPLLLEAMYFYAMYWDKIHVVNSGIFAAVPFASEAEFIKEGVLEKSEIFDMPPHESYISEDGSGYDMAKHELWCFGEAVKKKMQANGEIWSVNHITQDPIYSPQHRLEQDTLRIRINELLPHPILTGDFNVSDILEFKNKRADQYGEFNECLENFLSSLIREPLQDIRERELKRFELAVLELDKTILERFKFTDKENFEVSLAIPTDIPSIISTTTSITAGVLADQGLGSNFPYMTTLSTIGSMISISKKIGFTFNQYARDDLKFDYLTKAKARKLLK